MEPADLRVGDAIWMTWLKHWTDADELHRWFYGYSMALPRALPWPLTNGINDVDL